MLGLPAKHNDVFHCLYKGKFLVSFWWFRGELGLKRAKQTSWPTPAHLKLTKNLPLYN